MEQSMTIIYHVVFSSVASLIFMFLVGWLLNTKLASKIVKLTESNQETTVVTLFVILSGIVYFLIYHINYTNILK